VNGTSLQRLDRATDKIGLTSLENKIYQCSPVKQHKSYISYNIN